MYDNSKLFKKNELSLSSFKVWKNINLERGGIVSFHYRCPKFGGTQMKNLLGKVAYIMKRYGKSCKKLVIRFDVLHPEDKLSYILLECTICILMKIYYEDVSIHVSRVEHTIQTEGFSRSLLLDWIRKVISKNDFYRKFENRINTNTFRRIIEPNNSMAISVFMTDIKTFLKYFYLDREDGAKVAKIVSELADNACEHARSRCLIDIDVSNYYYREDDSSGSYYSVNICVLNFSDICLGDKIKEKMKNKKYRHSERYKKLWNAYEKHTPYFDEKYTEDCFFMLAAFQNRISGRIDETETGGKGLPELIQELESKAENHNCYVMSGRRVIMFHPDYLEYDADGWIGFNRSNNFLCDPPDKSVIWDSDTFINGTAYNLTLIYRRQDDGKE